MNNNEEHKNKVAMAIEVGRLLPETKEKVLFYKEIIESEKELIDALEKRKNSLFVSKITKAKERAEVIRLKNAILQKQKVFESYVKRKNEYEKWLDEMALEVNTKFDEVMEEAKQIPYTSNPRLQDGIKKFEELEETNTLQERVEFYLFLKNEVNNYKKFSKRK
jgi:hypothetical protein